jgi:hypothetical protein
MIERGSGSPPTGNTKRVIELRPPCELSNPFVSCTNDTLSSSIAMTFLGPPSKATSSVSASLRCTIFLGTQLYLVLAFNQFLCWVLSAWRSLFSISSVFADVVGCCNWFILFGGAVLFLTLAYCASLNGLTNLHTPLTIDG